MFSNRALDYNSFFVFLTSKIKLSWWSTKYPWFVSLSANLFASHITITKHENSKIFSQNRMSSTKFLISLGAGIRPRIALIATWESLSTIILEVSIHRADLIASLTSRVRYKNMTVTYLIANPIDRIFVAHAIAITDSHWSHLFQSWGINVPLIPTWRYRSLIRIDRHTLPFLMIRTCIQILKKSVSG